MRISPTVKRMFPHTCPNNATCNACVYLGFYSAPAGSQYTGLASYELYVCQDAAHGMLIARHGPRINDIARVSVNQIGAMFDNTRDNNSYSDGFALIEAFHRARTNGFIVP